jgi:hypothetical protein
MNRRSKMMNISDELATQVLDCMAFNSKGFFILHKRYAVSRKIALRGD